MDQNAKKIFFLLFEVLLRGITSSIKQISSITSYMHEKQIFILKSFDK